MTSPPLDPVGSLDQPAFQRHLDIRRDARPRLPSGVRGLRHRAECTTSPRRTTSARRASRSRSSWRRYRGRRRTCLPGRKARRRSPPRRWSSRRRKIEEVNLPKETPIEAEEPDRLVALENVKKPEEEEPEVKPTMANPSAESLAPGGDGGADRRECSARPRRRRRGIRGRERAGSALALTWQKELLAHLNRYKRYPADRTQKSAEILVTFNLDRTGKVLSATVANSSGDAAFDSAAVAMVQRANPVPAPPAAGRRRGTELLVAGHFPQAREVTLAGRVGRLNCTFKLAARLRWARRT